MNILSLKKTGALVTACVITCVLIVAGCTSQPAQETTPVPGPDPAPVTTPAPTQPPATATAPATTPVPPVTPPQVTTPVPTTPVATTPAPGPSLAPTPTPVPTPTPAPEPTTAPGLDIGQVLGKAADITSAYYESVTTLPGEPPFILKYWIKGGNIRYEMDVEGEHMIYILNENEGKSFMYMPDEGFAMSIPVEPQISAVDEAQAMLQYQPVIVGSETYDGKECLVVEYTAAQEHIRWWIWADTGFPVKTEVTTSEGVIVTEYRNIDFSDIDDSMFELPEGVEIVSMPFSIPGT